jgi:long-chain acyl-CoA synthetase
METGSTIIPNQCADTLPALFRERVLRTPETPAYRYFDALNGAWKDLSWQQISQLVARWQTALCGEGLRAGDAVAIMARNSHHWTSFDVAAMGLGLVVVPIFSNDRADNVRYILDSARVKLLVIDGEPQWEALGNRLDDLALLKRVVSLTAFSRAADPGIIWLHDWLPETAEPPTSLPAIKPDDLATIVFTSGTTGLPKGVMLSHLNILSNVRAGLASVKVTEQDIFLSFLPLSHTLERTIGCYLPMMAGATVAHARGVQELAEDLQTIRPTCLISVPRIYERVYGRVREGLQQKSRFANFLFESAVAIGWQRFEHQQGRTGFRASMLLWPLLDKLVASKIVNRLGGRLRIAISGGAPLSPEIARVFIGLGIPLLQGYGLTESSPVVSVNRLQRNIPASIGPALPGVEVRIGHNDELLVRGENVMLGYWENPAATSAVIDSDGWLHTGDKARMDNGFIFITGRIKDIIVLANGEKVPPSDMELAIAEDLLFEQVMVVGEGRPFLAALVVLNPEQWQTLKPQSGDAQAAEELVLTRIANRLLGFPGYAVIRRAVLLHDPWTLENALLTPTLKVKREQVMALHADEIARIYQGHSV